MILQHFIVDNNEDESGIFYDMIIGPNLIVQPGLSADFKIQVPQWYGVTVPKKEPRFMLGQTYLTSRKILEVVMQTLEPVYTRGDTERLVKILERTYVNSYLEQVSTNST